jgi:hypothetical protein
MAVKIVSLTKKQLVEFFQPYKEAFPDWAVEHDVTLTRTHGPVKQAIHFQALRSGAYRPSHAVDILLRVPDGCSILHKHLDVRHREVLPRDHATKWPLVLKAMEEQFAPSIRQPLDVTETLRLAEEEAARDRIDNINYSTGLAVLNAYFGHTERALYWCGRVEETAANLGRPLGDWEVRKRRYALELQQAVKTGKEQEFLS